jgi:dipeptidyl-peptidase 4
VTTSFPRQNARTRNFTLGAPRSFQISPDGGTIAFLRSHGGADPVTCLWAMDVATGLERLIADPAELAAPGAAEDPVEKARRERVREKATGIVAFAADEAFTMAAFALAGVVYLADLRAGTVRQLATLTPAADPRPDPAGTQVAYVSRGALRVISLESGQDRVLAEPEGADVTFGLADFIAAEEMDRTRGYWWAPDSRALLVARVDETPIQHWHVADPANPAAPANVLRYPSAGTANAVVSLFVMGTDAQRNRVTWDQQAFPYLVNAVWAKGQHPLFTVLSRDQREMRILAAEPETGATTVVRADTDAAWVDVVRGVPDVTASGLIVWTADSGGAKRLLAASPPEHADGTAAPLTSDDLQVREVLSVDGESILFSASAADPASTGLWVASPDGVRPVRSSIGQHSDGLNTGLLTGGTLLAGRKTLDRSGQHVQVLRPGADGEFAEVAVVGSLAEQPNLPAPAVTLGYSRGPSRVRTAIVLPSWHEPGSGKLPVLCDPYGGPHAQRVTAAYDAYLVSQWFADQGFAVVIADGRGTPGRGPAWDRTVAGDLATPALEDQVEALHSAAEQCADLDLSKVAIRGWSFGGYLSALAVLRRPDVFHAGIAGAPVTDWRLYDTGYTERYLGHPDFSPDAYEQSSLLADAAKLSRPLMIIHGLADDNVVVAHSLRLSSALLAAGRPHTVLPLSGVTHMAAQEEVAENLLLLQVDFLRSALGI